jgi:hypothetical protein
MLDLPVVDAAAEPDGAAARPAFVRGSPEHDGAPGWGGGGVGGAREGRARSRAAS